MKLNLTLLLFIVLSLSAQNFRAQSLSFERDRYGEILKVIKKDIEKNYYDPNYHGIDLEAKFKETQEKLKNASSIGQLSGIIAQFLIDFNDSHLFFSPPGKVNRVDYGFDMQMIGEKCYVVNVKAGTDAEKKGLQVGDEIFSIEGYAPLLENIWKMKLVYYHLRPRPSLKLQITKPDGKETAVEVLAKITEGKRLNGINFLDWDNYEVKSESEYLKAIKQYYFDDFEGLFIWKMPSFNLDPDNVDTIIDKIKKKNQSLIIDLRGNGGGRVDMLLRLIGNVFSEDIKVGDEKKRKETKEIIAKTRGKDVFNGKIVVLIDSESGSASEVFSKVIQFEKRGTIMGDKSAGAVMESMFYSHTVGVEIVAPYGISVTVADIIMKDGKSLERIGVMPDEKLLPTAQDLANKRDPVLARAIESLGFKITAENAGKIFPAEKQK